MRWIAAALALWLPVAALADEPAALRRFALLIGANSGGADRVRLRYALSDAETVRTVLTGLGGVEGRDVVLLSDPTPDAITEAFETLSQRIRAARADARRVEVVVYYSGHADGDGLIPGGDTYSWRKLRAELARLDADVRISILDACSSGTLLRTKGGTKRAPFLVDQASSVRGDAVLTSSTADEASQESDRIGASWFTHHLVAGLRGAADSDADGLVTLSEAYTYAFRNTRASTENSIVGPQSPAYDLDLSGQGDLVITDLRQADASLALDAALDGELWLRGSDGRLLMAVDKVPGKPMVLSVPPDTYRVGLQARPTAYSATVAVTRGTQARLAAGDFAKAELVADGRTRGAVEAAPPPERTALFGFQFAGAPKAADVAIDGFALHLLYGRHHSLRGLGLSPLGGTTVAHDAEGVQLATWFTAAGGDMVGVQGSMFANVVRGRMNGVQTTFGVNVIDGDSPDGTFGVQLASIGNIAGGGRFGGQLSTLFNVNRRHFTGAQLTAGVNVVGGWVKGGQIAGIGNIARDTVHGAQWAGLFNHAHGLSGVQTSVVNKVDVGTGAQLGVLNIAGRLRGFQLGLINVAGTLDGEALGLLTIARNGYHAFEVGSDDLTPVTLGFKFGSKHIYTHVIAGVDPVDGTRVSFGGGFGGHASFVDDRLFLDVDVGARTLEIRDEGIADLSGGFVGSLRVSFGGDIVPHFGLFIGPALHLVVPVTPGITLPRQSLMPGFSIPSRLDDDGGTGLVGHVGYQAGIRVRF